MLAVKYASKSALIMCFLSKAKSSKLSKNSFKFQLPMGFVTSIQFNICRFCRAVNTFLQTCWYSCLDAYIFNTLVHAVCTSNMFTGINTNLYISICIFEYTYHYVCFQKSYKVLFILFADEFFVFFLVVVATVVQLDNMYTYIHIVRFRYTGAHGHNLPLVFPWC